MAELRAQLERLVDDAVRGSVPGDPGIAWRRGRRRRTRVAAASALVTVAVIAGLAWVPRVMSDQRPGVMNDQRPGAAASGDQGGGLAPPVAKPGEVAVGIEHPPAGLPSTYRHRIFCEPNAETPGLVAVADEDGIDPLNSSSPTKTNSSPYTYVVPASRDDPLIPTDRPMVAIAVDEGDLGRETFLVVDVLEDGLRLDQPDASRGSMAGRWKLISMDAQSGAKGGIRTDRPAGTERAFVSWWCPPSR
jgi:hypothetical protein